jgi:hypothetical protein
MIGVGIPKAIKKLFFEGIKKLFFECLSFLS